MSHLDDTARRVLEFDDARRLALIDRDLWIGYGRAHDAHARLGRILRSERRMRPDNLLVVGASNNGKTAIARRFLARIPVALIQAPNGPRIVPLLTAILEALGRVRVRRTATAQLRVEACQAMQDVGLRLLLIDDLHNIRGAGVGSMLVELRQVGSVTGVSLGAFATKEIAYALRQDEQMANRFEVVTLPRWRYGDVEYAQLLATFERQLPLRRASNLTDPVLAEQILLAAGGLIGGVARLLRHAAAEAVTSGHERIDQAMLDRVGASTPERIEAIALAADL